MKNNEISAVVQGGLNPDEEVIWHQLTDAFPVKSEGSLIPLLLISLVITSVIVLITESIFVLVGCVGLVILLIKEANPYKVTYIRQEGYIATNQRIFILGRERVNDKEIRYDNMYNMKVLSNKGKKQLVFQNTIKAPEDESSLPSFENLSNAEKCTV